MNSPYFPFMSRSVDYTTTSSASSSSSSFPPLTSSSISWSPSFFHLPSSNPDNKKQITRAKIPSKATPFLNAPQRQQMEESARRCADVVCQIRTPDPNNRGTGCLIGGTLLLTNHHVLRNSEIARQSVACFFQVTSQNADGTETHVKIVKIALDPDSYFFTSPDRFVRVETEMQPQPASEGFLDFTVVAIKVDPYLSGIQHAVFPIFEQIPLEAESPVCVIQCPEVLNPDTLLQGDLKWAYGQIKHIETCSLIYNASTEEGSSGGAVIDRQGRLIALHHQGMADGLNAGILVNKIATALEDQKIEMDKWLNIPLPAPSASKISSTAYINLPASDPQFTGREKELSDFHDLCKNHRFVAVTGLGGIGKTTFITEYANRHQGEYRQIHFIQGSTESQLDHDLLELADELGIPPDDKREDVRLGALTKKLTHQGDGVLIVIDGVDDVSTLRYLAKQLPTQGNAKILLSSRSNTLPTPFVHYPLGTFSVEDAKTFLLKVVDGDDSNEEQATHLSIALKCFPLILAHAAAFIRYTPNYTFERYRLEYEEEGVELLHDAAPSFSEEEKGIFTTWNKSIVAIAKLPEGDLAVQIFKTLSTLGEGAVPLAIVKSRFKGQADRKIDLALGHLKNYSLLEVSPDTCALHSLVQQVICATIKLETPELVQEYRRQWLKVFEETVKPTNIDGFEELMRGTKSLVSHIDFVIRNLDISVLKENVFAFNYLSELCVQHHMRAHRLKNGSAIAQHHLKLSRSIAPRSLHVATSLGWLWSFSATSGDFQQAYTYSLEELAITQELFEGKGNQVAMSFCHLGIACFQLNRYEETLSHLHEALRLYAELPEGSKDRLCCMGGIHILLANIYSFLDSPEKAQEHREQAKGVIEDSGVLKQSDALFQPLRHAAQAIHSQSFSEFSQHLSQYIESVEARNNEIKQKCGKQSPAYLSVEFTSGYQYFQWGGYEKARPHFQRIKEATKNLTERFYIATLADLFLAIINLKQGKFEEALDLFLNIRSSEIQQFEDRWKLIQGIAVIYQALGRYQEALEHSIHSLELTKQHLETNDPRIAELLDHIGVNYAYTGKFEQAHRFCQEALSLRRLIFTEKKLGWVEGYDQSYYSLGIVYRLSADYSKALEMMKEALILQKNQFGAKHLPLANTYHELGLIHSALERFDEALKYHRLAYGLRKKIFDGEHPDLLASLAQIRILEKKKPCSHVLDSLPSITATRGSSALFPLIELLREISNEPKKKPKARVPAAAASRTTPSPEERPSTSFSSRISPGAPSSSESSSSMEEIANRYASIVCRIETPNPQESGSGVLIGGYLLLTCHHILRSIDLAKACTANFFHVIEEGPQKTKSVVEAAKIPLDPERFFLTSPPPKKPKQTKDGVLLFTPVDSQALNFTIVALKSHPYLSAMQDTCLSIFNDAFPTTQSPVCVIHDPQTLLDRDLRGSFGLVEEIEPFVLHYNVPVTKGSSGGAVIDSQGKFIALHFKGPGQRLIDLTSKERLPVRYAGSALLTSQIATALAGEREEIDKWLKIDFFPFTKSFLQQRTFINLPESDLSFVGREQELNALHELCQNHRYVAVTGPSGIGKTALIMEYVKRYQADYNQIHFLEGSSELQIDKLLAFAGFLQQTSNILEKAVPNASQEAIANHGKTILFVADAVNAPSILNYLSERLPNQSNIRFLISSDSNILPDLFASFALGTFDVEDAKFHLLKDVNGRDSNEEQARQLAVALGCFPLALAHAAAFIRSTPDYTFERYHIEYERESTELLQDTSLPFTDEEKRLFGILRKSISSIAELSEGHLAVEILQALSTLAREKVPLDLVKHRYDEPNRRIEDALGILKNYSLVELSSNTCGLHPTVQRMICKILEQDKPGIIQKCRQIWLSTVSNSRTCQAFEGSQSFVLHVDFILEKLDMESLKNNISNVNSLFKLCTDHYYDRHELKNAIAIGKRHLEFSRSTAPLSIEMANTLARLGEISSGLKNFEEAYAYHLEELALIRELFPEQGLRIAKSLYQLGRVCRMLQRCDEALSLLEQALHLHKAQIEKSEEWLIGMMMVCEGLAKVHEDLGHSQECKKYTAQQMSFTKKLLGRDNPFGSPDAETALGLLKMRTMMKDSKSVEGLMKNIKPTLDVLKLAFGKQQHLSRQI